ncbi:hypothetical protein EXU30_17310 [Shewanella maritima]|uniref:Uncharacterized protein n=1 Tax=Shewanella maritima TaxID=2520507 RepID=A0A411PL41_9GAMM|nr:hypothetical protein [Shewanella maritima]QBF84232.1 hypothetical protein EXU30_17310 [Shewanella maritima]
MALSTLNSQAQVSAAQAYLTQYQTDNNQQQVQSVKKVNQTNATRSANESGYQATRAQQQVKNRELPQPSTSVAISKQAQEKLAAELAREIDEKHEEFITPLEPTLPNEGEKIEDYLAFKKGIKQYQIYADLANIATGSNQHMSASTAYYLSNNDGARNATVNVMNKNMQMAAMQTYYDTTQAINTEA